VFLDSFKITGFAVAQIFLLAAIGFLLVKKNFLPDKGLGVLSRLVIEVTLPLLIFCQLLTDFRFNLFPNWWIFPLLSLLITACGIACGFLFLNFIKGGTQNKLQFLSLVAFQNSGYLPLALVDALLPKDQAATLFIYIFLFLLGFNLLMWSAGVYMLTFSRAKKFELGSFFSPPVIATLFSLVFIFLGLYKFVPPAVMRPLRMLGDCTLPLALMVVGGNLAQISLKKIDKRTLSFALLAKMLILPAAGLWILVKFRLPELLGLLILIQLAMPPATSSSLIIGHYKKEDLCISQGIFFGHLLSLVTLPVFLSIYFILVMIK
jgi:predicted permease